MTDAAIQTDTSTETAAADMKAKRRRWLIILAAVVVFGGLAWIVYDRLATANKVSTDNAYVGADTAQVTPQINAAVKSVQVRETDPVKAGQVLITLDDTDARLALASAEADLQHAVRQVRELGAQGQSLQAQTEAADAATLEAQARVTKAQGDLQRNSVELGRRERLARTGAVSGEELTSARNDMQTALSALREAHAAHAQAVATRTAAVATRHSNTFLVEGPIGENPDVAAAQTRVQSAKIELARTVIRAPIDGVIARRSVQVGQRVAVGAPLMSIVPIQNAYVDANFKEVQLKKVAAGMPATLTSDLYGSGVLYHGRVSGFAGGTGSAFALVPAQNATGNWIKIVQRLPVRIALDPKELQRHPLRVGLSMNATIDTAKR